MLSKTKSEFKITSNKRVKKKKIQEGIQLGRGPPNSQMSNEGKATTVSQVAEKVPGVRGRPQI